MHVTTARITRAAARVTAVFGAVAVTAAIGFASSAGAAGIGGGEGEEEGGGGGTGTLGSFVIGDQNATVWAAVTFWGAQWWKANSLSGGAAPASFKGFANSFESPPVCGASWSSDPGNSSAPPAGPLPATIEVIVASHVTKAGRTISGDTSEVVLVATNAGYQGNPGQAPFSPFSVGAPSGVAASGERRSGGRPTRRPPEMG